MVTTEKTLQAVVWKEGERYVSLCLNVEVSSFGDTKDEAIEHLKEALELYFEDVDDNEEIMSIEFPELVTISLT